MSKEIRLGLDCDGVLADFNTAFVSLARTRYPLLKCPDPSAEWPTKWDYLDDYLSKQQLRALWNEIVKENEYFWEDLPEYEWTNLLLLRAQELSDKLYYITSRSGPRVQLQTELWLSEFNMSPLTGGVIPVAKPEDKLPLVNALRLTHFVDDKPETVEGAFNTCLNTNIAIWDQPWNRHCQIIGVTRLKSVEDFETWLLKA